MIGRLSVTFVLLAVPAFGQSRVYTNADLGKVHRTHTATEEELAGLRAHQFMAIPDRPAGPEVIIGSGSPNEGPFGPFYMTANEPHPASIQKYGRTERCGTSAGSCGEKG